MCEAEVILELPTARLVEIIPGAAASAAAVVGVPVQSPGKEQPVLTIPVAASSAAAAGTPDQHIIRVDTDISVISVRFSDEEIAAVQAEVGVQKHALSAPGVPLLFILAGDYKIPIRSECPARLVPQSEIVALLTQSCPTFDSVPVPATRQYEFDVLGLKMRIVFSSETSLLLVEHFETVLVQQHALKMEQREVITNVSAALALVPGMAVQPQWDQPAPGSQPKESATTMLLEGMNTVGSVAASGLRSGALLLSHAIAGGAQYIVENTDKRAPEDAVPVPESWQAGVKSARVVSKSAVKVSSGVAKSLIGVTSVVSDIVAAKLREVIKNSKEEEESETTRSAKSLGIGLAGTAVNVYEAATDAARTILVASSASIAAIVDHKMGRDAGLFVEDGLGMVQDGYDAAKAASSVGTTGILKQTLHATMRKTLDDEKLIAAQQASKRAALLQGSSNSQHVKVLDDDQ